MWKWLVETLHHDRMAVRAAGAVVSGYALLFVAWGFGYHLLPEGILRGKLSGGIPVVANSVLVLALQLVGFNVVGPGLLLLLSSRLQVGRFSLGYSVAFVNVVLYGLWLGTNSFSVPMPERIGPTLAVFWQRSGPYEMLAFLLMAAALARTAVVRQLTFWRGRTVPVPPAERQVLGAAECVALGLAVGALVAANVAEASMMMRRLSG